MKKLLVACLAIIATKAWALDPNHFTITRITAPYFIVDGNTPATINKAYVGFEVKNNSNSGVTYTNLKFTITSISTSVVGQNYGIVSPVSGVINIGTLAPGQSKICYYYCSYPANATPVATFNVQLSDLTASNKSTTFSIRNRSSISANAGGTATQSISNQDLIGGIIVDTVTYVVGNVQNGDESDFQVAVSSQFDPTKVLLLGTQVVSSSVPGIPAGTTDSLYFITGNGSNGATISVRWLFRITGYNYTNYLLPCAGATSGSTNYKYALNTSLGSGTPIVISASANPLTITKTSDKTLYGRNTTAIFTVTITNPGAYGVTVDKITDEIPAGFTYQSLDASSQVTAANSTTIPSSGATGTITFEGGVTGANTSYYVPANGSIVLKYTTTSSATQASNLITNAKDYIGITQVGSASHSVSVSATLPVRLLSFSGSRNSSGIQLDWQTSDEVNCLGFEIERANNNSFIKIGTVAARGNTSTSSTYTFIDSFPSNGNNRYRLKMVDQDLRSRYSSVIEISADKNSPAIGEFYPNPFYTEGKVSLSLNKTQNINCRLYDIAGNLVNEKTIVAKAGETTIYFNQLTTLRRGTYLLMITSAEGAKRQKIVKLD